MKPLKPENNKFHKGNGVDGKHYWLTPPEIYNPLNKEFNFDFDPCPYPKPDNFDGLINEWGECNYVNPPFGSIIHQGPNDKNPKKKGPTAWVRKAMAENDKGKKVVLVYPIDKWILMLLERGAKVRNLKDIKWLATEDGSPGKGTGRHIACFVLDDTTRDNYKEEELKKEKESLWEDLENIAFVNGMDKNEEKEFKTTINNLISNEINSRKLDVNALNSVGGEE